LAQGQCRFFYVQFPSTALARAMSARALGVTAAATAGAVALHSLSKCFVPGAPGVATTEVAPALRSQGQQPSSPTAIGGVPTVAAVALAAVGAGIARRTRPSRVARAGVRRELAVAYEDSGISLVDNGEFAQGLVGADGAWGRYEFDPAGLSKYTEAVAYFREAELKHGRIAMLAWLGLVVPDFVRIPGERYSFEQIPVTIDAHDLLNGAVGVNAQILFWISIVELCCAKKVFEWNSTEVAGDYNLTNLFPKDEEGQKRMRMAELKNGRLAMVAFGGAITQAAITRHPFPWLF